MADFLAVLEAGSEAFGPAALEEARLDVEVARERLSGLGVGEPVGTVPMADVARLTLSLIAAEHRLGLMLLHNRVVEG